MILDIEIFKIPIYSKSYKRYCKEFEKNQEKMRLSMEAIYQKSYSDIDHDKKVDFENDHELPPWKYNCTIGFVEIGFDKGERLTGNILLKRKYLPKKA